MRADDNQITLYQAPDGALSLEVRLQHETVWLSAHQMARLFGRDRTVIVRHIHNIYATEELVRAATCAENAQVAADGRIREMDLYNLDMIISVGYRVNSKRGTQFRIWATNVLREHILRGYTVNQRRLQELNQVVRLVAAVTERRTWWPGAGRTTGKPWSGSWSTSLPGGTRRKCETEPCRIVAPRRGAYRGNLRSGGVGALGAPQPPATFWHPSGMTDATPQGCQTVAGGRA
jgi:hypothetical protein